jgi:hypothetical protein
VCAALASFGLACGEGTSGWILTATDAGGAADASTTTSDGASADAAELTPEPEPDAGTDAGMPEPLRDPEAFAAACAPQVTIDNQTADGNGALFEQAFTEPVAAMADIAKQVCARLYKTPEEVPVSPPIMLVIEDFYGIGEVSITGPVIYMRLSSLHMQSTAADGKDVRDDIRGNLFFLLAIDYVEDDENPASVRWVTEGLGAFVQYRAGYLPIAARRPGDGPRDDYKATGFFFDWLDRNYDDAVYRLNQSLDPDDQRAWSERVFQNITGKDLSTLWAEYQATL